ncbi:hypothetical protein NOF04DRAFT_4478 [Fusarium oxysporum II5]|uniref:Uncharacterized protein n=1 Tax=Fusarium odoratissimum (strain NRRL 54006) TaxID=1089451 RepID=X0JU88_FUSO5|nr:uncharacterized protein FOIG_08106 [Fusarium odoratissimum NRRL 54006]EXM00042.1 hypothetical protein FOIG_08106 [Fusarium odoratissimum NRRL 54006]KAK2135578.1 hypothetical protein NOF04DRAFT_4478 [Fusarium oxysporum II5]
MASIIKLHATGMPVMVVFFVTGFYHVHNMTMANQPLVIDRYVIKMKEAIRRPRNSMSDGEAGRLAPTVPGNASVTSALRGLSIAGCFSYRRKVPDERGFACRRRLVWRTSFKSPESVWRFYSYDTAQ